jgi:fucose 4-O-acetylase-like acetyltransferase
VTDTLQAFLARAGVDVSGDLPRFLAYTLVALICTILGGSPRMVPRKLRMLWLQLGVLYLLAAINALFQGDELWLHWAREYARAHDSYNERRPFQFAVLLALLLLFAASWKLLRKAADTDVLRIVVLTGACGTLSVHLLSYVSFHYTDLVLNAFWMDHSISTWVELASLSLTGTGTAIELVRSNGHG